MSLQWWTSRWWEVAVVVLSLNSAVFGFLFAASDDPELAVILGFVPAALLAAGLALRNAWRAGATVMVIAGSLLAAGAFWVVYTVVLALAIIAGSPAKERPQRQRAEAD